MKKLLKKLLSLLAAGTAAFFVRLFVKERMDYGSSYQRPGRWY